MSSSLPKLNNRIWITRIKRGIARKQLAARLGHKTTSQLCRWEEGVQAPNLPNALILGHFLQMPVEFLFKEMRDELVSSFRIRYETEEYREETAVA